MWPVIVRRGIIPRRIIGRRRVIGLPVIAAIIQGRGPNKSPDRCGDDHCGGIENSAHHAEWPLKGERRAGRIVLSLGGREWQSGKSDAERARYSNSADTHQGSHSYLPTGRCGRPTPDETGRGPIPAKAGTHLPAARAPEKWTPAFRRGSVQCCLPSGAAFFLSRTPRVGPSEAIRHTKSTSSKRSGPALIPAIHLISLTPRKTTSSDLWAGVHE
jgi:hypothetical protein